MNEETKYLVIDEDGKSGIVLGEELSSVRKKFPLAIIKLKPFTKVIPKFHILKTWPEYFNAMKYQKLEGAKNFELRKNDRDYQVGDILVLRMWVPDEERYTFQCMPFWVTYILKGEGAEKFGLKPGYCIMSVRKA